jgi:hypothetical protein
MSRHCTTSPRVVMLAGVVIATNSSVPVTCTAPVAGGEAAGASGLEDIAAPLVTTTSGDGLGAEDVRVVGEAVAAAMHPARSEVQAKPTNSQRPASRVLIVSTPRDARRGRSRQQPGTVPAARVWAAPRCLQRAVEHPPRAAHGQAPSATLTVRTPERACARLARGPWRARSMAAARMRARRAPARTWPPRRMDTAGARVVRCGVRSTEPTRSGCRRSA